MGAQHAAKGAGAAAGARTRSLREPSAYLPAGFLLELRSRGVAWRGWRLGRERGGARRGRGPGRGLGVAGAGRAAT